MVPFLKTIHGNILQRRKSFKWHTLKHPQKLLLGDHLFVFSFTLESFSERNIHCKHNKKMLSKRKWRPHHVSWQKYSPSHFWGQQFLAGPPGPEPRWGHAEVPGGVGRSGGTPPPWLGFRVWQAQTACPPASLTSCAAGRLRVTPGSLSSCSRLWARAPLLSVVVFYDSRSWSPDARKRRRPACALLIWLWPSGRGTPEGKPSLAIMGLFTNAFAWLFFLDSSIWNSVFSLLPASS